MTEEVIFERYRERLRDALDQYEQGHRRACQAFADTYGQALADVPESAPDSTADRPGR